MSVLRLFLAVACLALASTAVGQAPEVVSQIKLKPMSKQQYLDLHAMGLDIHELRGEDITVFAKPGDLLKLQQAGIAFDVIHPDVKEFYEVRNTEDLPFGGFRTYEQIKTYLDSLAAEFPDITTDRFSIGFSIEGRQQWVMKVSDNPDIDEEEPEVLFISLIHAREPAAAAALLYFLEHLLTNYGSDPDVTDLVDNRELFFLPVQNPDGYTYNEEIAPEGGGMWRKNRRLNYDFSFGVDLNRNYSYMWGYDDLGSDSYPSGTLYRGTAGFSEPETDNVRAFVVSQDFKIIHNFHCYSDLEIWAPSYDRIYGLQQDFYANLGDSLTQYNGYSPGIGWTLYPTNGDADDWAWCDTISKPQIISLTVEIGSAVDGFWPNPQRIPVLCEENLFPNLYLAGIADNPYVIAPPGTPIITSPESADSNFTVSWYLDDEVNPGVSYRLIEYTGKEQVNDDAEGDYGYWDAANMVLSSARSYAGSSSWHTGNYNRSHHWLLSETPYEVKSEDWLRFYLWYDLEEHYDYFYAQVSTDGGFTYENLPCLWSTNDDPNNINLGNGITGVSGGWVLAEFDLVAYEGQQILIRLSYFTDSYTLGEGVYIDNIENVDIFQTSTEISSALTDTLFAFTSKPPGEYWYRVAATDAEGQEGRLSSYTGTKISAIVCCDLMGDANGDDDLTTSDITFMIQYAWLSGPGPECEEELDVNGDKEITPADIVYLIEHAWKGGPAPVECHPLD